MTKKLYEDANIQDIADAIREKNGAAETYRPAEMGAAVRAIQSGDGWNVVDALIDGSITEITSNVKKINDYAFYECEHLVSANFPLAETINMGCFQKCTALTEINLPELRYSRNNYIFDGCSSLTKIDLPLLEILTNSNYMFQDCKSLVEANLPKIKYVQSNMFNNCITLEKVNVPSATLINANAFKGCSILNVLVLRSETVVSLVNVNAFANTPFRGYNGLRGTYYVPQALIEEYTTTATNWSALYAEGFCDFLPIEGSIYE